MRLPIEFEERMKRLLGAEYDAFYHALCYEDAVKGLRVNPVKVSFDEFGAHAPFALTPLSYVEGGYVVDAVAQAGKHPYHAAGAYYMQDPGAMATVAALPDDFWERSGLRILDLCAAPGGKTTQLASLCYQNGGVVLANEYVSARSRILAGNVERMGLDNVCVTNADSRYLAEWYPAFFDLVVVDAPCSGEGMYRKNEQAIAEWSPENVRMCATRQREILDNAAQCVAEGGYLLYSTCTYSTEENEESVLGFLSRHPAFRLCPMSEAVNLRTAPGIALDGSDGVDLSKCRRFYPHVSKGEGQFLALLQRVDGEARISKGVKDSFVALAKSDRTVAESFLREVTGNTPLSSLGMLGGNLILFGAHDASFPLPPFGVVSAGVMLGELRKGRIVPHHHFFSAYGKSFASRLLLDADDPRVSRYLAGEEIEVSGALDSMTAVLLRIGNDAVLLGGGKAVGNRLKNYYPKGLRVH